MFEEAIIKREGKLEGGREFKPFICSDILVETFIRENKNFIFLLNLSLKCNLKIYLKMFPKFD